jgi:hypothetical protein
MKAILFILSVLFAAHAGAQPLTDINRYLNNPKIHAGAKDYYNEVRKAGVDSFTTRIADSLQTRNNSTRPFYMLLVSRMLMYADAGLATMLFDDCFKVLEKRPNELLEFLYNSNNLVYTEYRNYWAGAIVGHIGKEHRGETLEFFGKLRPKLMKTCKKHNKANMTAFLDSISAGLTPQ